MNFFNAIKFGFKKYAKCSGRASRSEFWYWMLFVTILKLGIVIVGTSTDSPSILALFTLVPIILFIPTIAVAARRLQDTNRSQWWWLLSITVVGLIPLIIWWCQKGTDGDNRYGLDPLKEVV